MRKNPMNEFDYDGNDDQIDALKDVIRAYWKLHDGLSEMIEEGRLAESAIPDDYQWLVEQLVNLANIAHDPTDPAWTAL